MKIFLSSTYNNLIEERAAAIEIIERIGEAYAMEKFYASNHRSKDECIKKLRECDLMILILGNKLGSIDEETGFSITELEYRTAVELDLPRLVFVKLNENGEWDSAEIDEERQQKHTAFKSVVERERLRRGFKNSEELKIEILLSICNARDQGILGSRLRSFQSLEDFINPYMKRKNIFNHTYALVGRDNYIKLIIDFVLSPKRIAVLNGRGGIGKTRILIEVLRIIQKESDSVRIMILRDGTVLDNDVIKEIPEGQVLIVVDDVHRVNNLQILLSIGMQHAERVKLIFSSRPYGLTNLQSAFLYAGYVIDDIEWLPELFELEHKELQALAEEVLGTKDRFIVDRLVEVSKDSPLITVLGGQLLVEKQIDPALLSNTQDFRQLVLARFKDILVDNVGSQIGSKAVRRALPLIAALAPINPEHSVLINGVAEFLEIKPYEFKILLNDLEKSGFLLRRGYSLRITPDVLSDYFLNEACINSFGEPTGFAYEMFDKFKDISLENLLKNLSELDWRISGDKKYDLLKQVWQEIKEWVTEASHLERATFLNILNGVASYQPKEALELIELMINQPATEASPGPYDRIYRYTHNDVLHNIPRILHRIAYHFPYLKKASNILWLLGRNDERNARSHTDHAVRILEEIAGYEIRKPLLYNETILELVADWMSERDAFDYFHSPIDILDPLLVKQGSEDFFTGNTINIRPFAVNPDTTYSIRERAIALLEKTAELGEPKVKSRILSSLLDSLNDPISSFGREVILEELKGWEAIDRRVVEAITKLLSSAQNPVLYCQAKKDLNRKVKYKRGSVTIAEEISRLIDQIPDDNEQKLIQFLIHGLWQSDFYQEKEYSKIEREVDNEANELVKWFLDLYKTAKEVKSEIEHRIKVINECGIGDRVEHFISYLPKHDIGLSSELCSLIITDPHSSLSPKLNVLLSQLRNIEGTGFSELVKMALVSNDMILLRSLGWMYSTLKDFNDEEKKIIRQLLGNTNREVIHAVIYALKKFSAEDRHEVFGIISELDIGADKSLAEKICSLFDDTYGIPYSDIPISFAEFFLGKLVPIREISGHDYYIMKFLNWLNDQEPQIIAGFFLDRLRYMKDISSDEEERYQPVPFARFTDFSTRAIEDKRYQALCLVRDNILETNDYSGHWIAHLFAAMSGNFDELSMKVLSEWTETLDPKKIGCVGELLQEAPENYVFEHIEFIVGFINSAERCSSEILDSIRGNLYSCTASRGGTGTPGEPLASDVELRDKAKAVADSLQEGTAAKEFFKDLQRSAEDSIEQQRKWWEEKEF